MSRSLYIVSLLTATFLLSCADNRQPGQPDSEGMTPPDVADSPEPYPLAESFKSYWYAGEAELTSYELQQARYGELRNGHAVLIYVTEPFDPVLQVKDDRKDEQSLSVLKLNRTKKFLTGIYPYSVMSSIFYPVGDHLGALKVSTSVQEWCGHVYTQLNKRDSLQIRSHSYFEGEADQDFKLPEGLTEDGIWTKIRIAPDRLPEGEVQVIPSLEFLRLSHAPVQAYAAELSLTRADQHSVYTLTYPELQRSLEIRFESDFPHTILGWTESYPSGFGPGATVMRTTARRMETLKSPYWKQNAVADTILRERLGL